MHDASAATTTLSIALVWGGVLALFLWEKLLRDAFRRFCRRSRISQALIVLGVAVAVGFGGSKGGNPPLRTQNASSPTLSTNQCLAGFALVAADTNAIFSLDEQESATVHTNWLLRGASRDAFVLSSTTNRPWSFLLGTNRIRRVWVSAGGTVSFSGPFDSATGTLPDDSAPDHIAPFHATLGIVPAANWHLLPTNAPVGLWTLGLSDFGLEATGPASCFWHDTTDAGSLLLTWNNALLNLDASATVSFQAELFPSGDFAYRYDFGDTVPTNAVIGAQNNGGGESWTNAPHTHLELRWRHFSGVGPGAADTDGDGLPDYDEVFVLGTDPASADSDGDGIPDGLDLDQNDCDADADGIPDGADADAWAAHPFFAGNAGFTNLVLTVVRGMGAADTVAPHGVLPPALRATPLSEGGGKEKMPPSERGDAPEGQGGVLRAQPGTGAEVQSQSALLDVGGLKIPLRIGDVIPLGLPAGVEIAAALRVRGNLPVRLQLSPGSDVSPFHLDDSDGIFSHVVSSDATATLSFPRLSLVPQTDSGTTCLHEGDWGAEFRVLLSPMGWDAALASAEIAGFDLQSDGTLWLDGPPPPYESATGTVTLRSPWLLWGTLSASASVHWCVSSGAFCHACGTVHDEEGSCSHDANCAARLSFDAECDCSPIFLRVNFDDDDLNDVEDRNETPDVAWDDDFEEFRFVGIGDCCCETWQGGDARARITSLSPGLRLWTADGTRLLSGDEVSETAWVEATAHSPTNGAFVLSYEILDSTGGVVRALSRRFTAANVEILPDMDGNGLFDADDRFLRETLEPGDTWKVVRQAEPYRVRLRNACPSDATLRVLWSMEGTNGPAFSTDSSLTSQYLAPNTATTNAPFALPNLMDEFLIDASRTSSVATLTYSLDVGGMSPAVADSLSVRIVDIDLPDRAVRPSDLADLEYDLSDASGDVSWILRDAATETEIDWWYGPVYLPPTNLSCGDYEVDACVWDVWEDGVEGAIRTATLRVADIAIEREAYAVQVGSDTRIRIALDPVVSSDAADWSIAPTNAGVPRIYSSATGGSGVLSIANATEVWVGADSGTGEYALTASCHSATNIIEMTTIHAIRFDLSNPRMVMRERGESTNVLHVVSSDGCTADWVISQDSQYQFNYPKAQISAVEGGSGNSVFNASRVWITPGVSNVQYTVTATHREWTNITATADLKVCFVKLSPITTDNYGGTNYNPCAIANNRPGRFKITVEPQSFVPDADIEWVSSPQLTSLFGDCHSGTGRVVNVLPIGIGTTRTLQIHIKDFIGSPPEISYEAVGAETTIPVKVYVAKDSNGNPVVPTSQINSFVQSKIAEINAIYRQTGLRFSIDYPVQILPQSLGAIFDVNSQSDIDAVLSATPNYNGAKVYVIDSFYSGTNLLDVAYTAIAEENGSRVSYGAMIPFFFESIYWAHEIGHICGLDDIYHDVNSLLTYNGPFVAPQTNSLTIVDAQDDYSAYEEPELRRFDVIPRLLMCGHSLNEQERLNHTDIPAGSIRGLTNDNNGSFIEQLVNVGLQSLNRNPTCKQR